jgi:hypothetical protein
MVQQIAADELSGLFDSWGLSTVIDENINAPVIPRDTFELLHRAAGIDARWPIGNAGLIHVYGYLLSTVETPYGLKRDRWLDGVLAAALGRAPEWFRLEAADAAGETVLRRVTDAALPVLTRDVAGLRLSFDRHAPDGSGVFFRTRVVEVGGAAALIYGVFDGTQMRLITTFPLTSASDEALDALESEPPRMRYNAATELLPPGSPLTAT